MKHFMKPTLFVLITVLGASLAILPAHAQSFSRVRVNVPFDFSVGNTPLKAGNYTGLQLEPGIIVFSGNGGQQSQIAATVVLDLLTTIKNLSLYLVVTEAKCSSTGSLGCLRRRP